MEWQVLPLDCFVAVTPVNDGKTVIASESKAIQNIFADKVPENPYECHKKAEKRGT